MQQHEPYFDKAIKQLLFLRSRMTNIDDRKLIERIIENVKGGAMAVEDAIWEAKNLGARNPGFDGDMVGDWDDE